MFCHRILWITVICLVVACTPATGDSTSMPQNEYTFRTVSDSQVASGTSKLSVPREIVEAGKFGDYRASFRGSVLALFGPPLYTSDLADEAYDYVIEATDRNNKSWILTVYEGSSGPSIGGDSSDDSIMPAATALLNLIQSTKPADFEATIYDDDTDNTVTYGCKEGRCYSNEIHGNHLSP